MQNTDSRNCTKMAEDEASVITRFQAAIARRVILEKSAITGSQTAIMRFLVAIARRVNPDKSAIAVSQTAMHGRLIH